MNRTRSQLNDAEYLQMTDLCMRSCLLLKRLRASLHGVGLANALLEICVDKGLVLSVAE